MWAAFAPLKGFDPHPFTPSQDVPFTPNKELKKVQIISKEHVGAEDFAFDKKGRLYTGLANGTILRMNTDETFEFFSHTNGRPLALKFNKKGDLIVADAILGLLSVDEDGEITILSNHYKDNSGVVHKINFADHFDMDSEDNIYFSDASSKWNLHQVLESMLEGRPTGSILKYDPKKKTTSLVVDKLSFANGVLVSKDDDYLLIAESGSNKITKYWLKGSNKGKLETFCRLPGVPDNLSLTPRGTIWVSMPILKDSNMDTLMQYEPLRRLLVRFLKCFIPPLPTKGAVAEIDKNGNVLRYLFDPEGEKVYSVTTAVEKDNNLYLGTYDGSFIAKYNL